MREQLDFSREGSSGFSLILACFLLHLVFFPLDLDAFALDVQAQAVEYRDVLVGYPHQGEEPKHGAAPTVIDEVKVRYQ